MYVKRIAESTTTFTQGKMYRLIGEEFCIINDKGNKSKPAANLPAYWKKYCDQSAEYEINLARRQSEKQATFALRYGMGRGRFTRQFPEHDYAELEQRILAQSLKGTFLPIGRSDAINSIAKQENIKMLTINKTEVISINNNEVKRVEDGKTILDASSIIHHMKNEKEKLSKLKELGIESKALDRIMKGHEDNIAALVKILEDSE